MFTRSLQITSMLFGIVRICWSLFNWYYLKNKKVFLSFFFSFFNFQQILNISKKDKIVIANVLPILQTVKDLVRPLSKKRRFRTSFDSENVKGSLTLVKSTWEHFHHIFSSLWGDMSWKVCLFVEFEILGVFVSTLTADHKYAVWDCENLPLPIEMILS